MRRIIALVVATGLLSACASFTDGDDPKRCAMMFAGAGAVGGGLGGYDYARNHNDAASARPVCGPDRAAGRDLRVRQR